MIVFAGVSSASAEVGVSVGQLTEYTYGMSAAYRDKNGTLLDLLPYSVTNIENITVLDISGTNITIESQKLYLADQTNQSMEGWIDLSTGEGPASGYLILPNINAGDLIYPDWEGGEQQVLYVYTINETILTKDGDETVEVNHATVTSEIFNQTANYDMTEFFNQTSTIDYYWEKSTGLLLAFTETSVKELENSTETVCYQYQKVGLQQTFYPYIDNTDVPVTVDSNSAILGFIYDQTEQLISLTVSGKAETSGTCSIAVPVDLLSGNLSMLLEDTLLAESVDYTKTSNSTHNMFEVTFSGEGTHTITVSTSDEIPEFPDVILLSMLTVAVMLAAIMYRKRLYEKR
jgi:hypothetical protein